MKRFDFIAFLMNPKKWRLPLLIIFIVSLAGVMMIGIHTYTEAPPIANFVSEKGETIFSKDDILKGQAVFQKYALMEYGSMFGDGADRGPDFTADALHETTLLMNEYYSSALTSTDTSIFIKQGISEQVKNEIKSNRYNEGSNSVTTLFGEHYFLVNDNNGCRIICRNPART
jgi:nitric oxide reductase subunit B